jgi:hypothetical protein
MQEWIYLSKHGVDEYINLFASGSGVDPTPLELWEYGDSTAPLVIRGIMKHKIMKRCWDDNRPFLFMDTGYFGNRAGPLNPHGWKMYHRIVPNNFQHGKIIPRPADRWERLKIQIKSKQSGSKILIAAPDEKPCSVYNITLEGWLRSVLENLKQHTDREIVIRQRDPNRRNRVNNDFQDALKDIHAVVTFNSNAATEAIISGVPAFVTAPCHAALPVANTDISKIESPFFPDMDLMQQWARHLAYGQFHNTELADGSARKFLEKEFP